MDGTELVARFVHGLSWEALPSAVQHKARLVFCDAVAATLTGTQAHIADVTARFATRVMPGNEATIIATGEKATAAGAAFANANVANAFDVDDVGQYTRGHPGAQLIPASLAAAEKLDRSGKDVLTAMTAGYEVACRAGRCWHDHHTVYQACGSWGSVACAAVAAHLMGLDVPDIWHALGIAEYHSPNLPIMRDVLAPGMVKHGIGWGAMSGILAAELAHAGFTGFPSIFSLDKYWDWVCDIGDHYIMQTGAMFKEHALCGWSHAAVEAVKLLKQRHAFEPADIQHIHLEGFHDMVLLGSRSPKTTEEAQYNTGWGMVVQLLDGEVGPQQLLEERLRDPIALELLSKVELVEAERFNEEGMRASLGDADAEFCCRVEITLKDGRKLDSGKVAGHNKYATQWSDEQLQSKFRWLTRMVLNEAEVERLLDMAWNFDTVEQVSDLIELMKRAQPRRM